MDIAVVDDEKVIREQLREMIENQKPDCGTCDGTGSFLSIQETGELP